MIVYKPEYNEGLAITQRLMRELVNFTVDPGLDGANFRTAVGQLL